MWHRLDCFCSAFDDERVCFVLSNVYLIVPKCTCVRVCTDDTAMMMIADGDECLLQPAMPFQICHKYIVSRNAYSWAYNVLFAIFAPDVALNPIPTSYCLL